MPKLFKRFVREFAKWSWLALLIAVMGMTQGCSTSQPNPSARMAPIRSTGIGVSLDDAKLQAFKQAIENRIGVLVLSDREIQNYRLLKDEILTYSAGYIDDYNIVKQEKIGAKWVVVADVWVSSSKLTGRIISTANSDGRINGKKASDSFSSFVRQKEQADRLSEKVLMAFPSNALMPKFSRSEIKFDANRNAKLLIYFQTNWNKSYLDSVRELLSLIQDGGDGGQARYVQVLYQQEESDWFPSRDRFKVSDVQLHHRFATQFSNDRIAIRLRLKGGVKTVHEDCWGVPDSYVRHDPWGNISILGQVRYESVITLTIPYRSDAQRVLEASNNVELRYVDSSQCQRNARSRIQEVL